MAEATRLGIIGATGLVGQEMLAVLDERGFEFSELRLFASPASKGKEIEHAGSSYTLDVASSETLQGLDIVLMSAGGAASQEVAPIAAAAGALVIDNSSAWRMDPEVPLVVPEVNPEAAATTPAKGIIANPNCSTIQMVVALKPLHEAFGLRKVVVSTYQAVSGAGKAAMDELGTQVQQLFNNADTKPEKFSREIAFDCLPEIDRLMDDGFTKEEHKMREETRKIMDLPSLDVQPTCVRVPVFNGHAESVYCEFEKDLTPAEAYGALREAPGIIVVGEPGAEELDYPTQKAVSGADATYVGRIRQDASKPRSLHLWVVADNLRKGAATNAVQIAEIVARSR